MASFYLKFAYSLARNRSSAHYYGS